MTQPVPALQVPQHVTAQLSHLTSRPGVQSTLILSRKDGSIIQATGQLATQSGPSSSSPAPHTPAPESAPSIEPDAPTFLPNDPAQRDLPDVSSPAKQETPYKPTQTETLAAHIFSHMSSASALGTCLSRPATKDNNDPEYRGSNTQSSDYAAANSSGGTKRDEDNDREGHEREEDDELKLLRLRTKAHEIIIIPDRRFLLCVVHDVSGNSSGGR